MDACSVIDDRGRHVLKNKSVLSTLAQMMEGNKRIKIAVYAGVVIIALLIFFATSSGGSTTKNKQDDSSKVNSQNPQSEVSEAHELEQRLETILSSMSGVGKVKVMITFESTSELIIATENESNESENGTSNGSRPATLSGSGGESPIILTQINPKIRGVVVIAEGASSISVKMDILAATSTVLGVKENCVEVFEMNSG